LSPRLAATGAHEKDGLSPRLAATGAHEKDGVESERVRRRCMAGLCLVPRARTPSLAGALRGTYSCGSLRGSTYLRIESAQPGAKAALAEIWAAEDREHAEYGTKWPKAAAKITDDLDVLLAFCDYTAEHWIHLRTTNPIESTFATARLRQRITKGPGSRAAGVCDGVRAHRVPTSPVAIQASENGTNVWPGRPLAEGLPPIVARMVAWYISRGAQPGLALVLSFTLLGTMFSAAAPVQAAGCYVRSAPSVASAPKNFADNDIVLSSSNATLKGAVSNNGYGTGTRTWNVPPARVCSGDHLSLTISAGGQLPALSRFWSTTGNHTERDLNLSLGGGFPERDFLALAPGGDLGGTAGSRTYTLDVADFPFTIGVWVRDFQGDTGVVVWNYVADSSHAPVPAPVAHVEPSTPAPAMSAPPAPPLAEPAEAPAPNPDADLQAALSACPGAYTLFTTLQANRNDGTLVSDVSQSALSSAWPRRDVFLGMLEKIASTSIGSTLFDSSPYDMSAGTGYENYLGSLLTEQAPPRHPQNTYVQLTRDRHPLIDGIQQASYESALADRIAASSGGLMPADVLQMALRVTSGDYPLATLTAHNLLKELKYSSEAQGGTGVAVVGWFPDHRGTDADALGGAVEGYDSRTTGPLIANLANLRPADDPLYATDPIGPWYHQFGVLFVGSVTSGDEATLSAWVENAMRRLSLGSSPDPFKQAINTCSGTLAEAVAGLDSAPTVAR
jgi:hypothetical protein